MSEADTIDSDATDDDDGSCELTACPYPELLNIIQTIRIDTQLCVNYIMREDTDEECI